MSSLDNNEPNITESRMVDLEHRLRGLSVVTVPAQLDARVFEETRGRTDCGCQHAPDLPRRPSAYGNGSAVSGSSEGNGTAYPSRNSGVVSIAWLACAVSMVLGALAGRLLIPGTLRTPATGTGAERAVTAELSVENDLRTTNSVSQTSPWTLESALNMGSKLVESSRFSPSVGAVAWEQQTGEIFRVGTHQTDRRFAMCRECHRVGG